MSAEPNHRHCRVCGKVCSVDDETCSRACRDAYARRVQSKRNLQFLLYASIALIAVVFLAQFFR